MRRARTWIAGTPREVLRAASSLTTALPMKPLPSATRMVPALPTAS
ncbi:hypothetical protein [Streptomyces collinus]